MITLGDAARILTKIAAFDQRTIGEADIAAWHEALNLAEPAIDRDDALAAVTRWHAEAVDGRIRPAHVIHGAQALARKRAGAARRAQLEAQMELEAAEVIDRTEDVIAMVNDLMDRMGTGNPGVLRRREWYEREQRERRERTDGPNPRYDPKRAAAILRRNSEPAP